MYVVGWFATGVILAVLFFAVGRQWRGYGRINLAPVTEHPRATKKTAAEWLEYVARSILAGGPPAPATVREEVAPTSSKSAVVWKATALATASTILIWFAIAGDRASLLDFMLWARACSYSGPNENLLNWKTWEASQGVRCSSTRLASRRNRGPSTAARLAAS